MMASVWTAAFVFFSADTNGVACICPYLYEGRRCEKYMWWTQYHRPISEPYFCQVKHAWTATTLIVMCLITIKWFWISLLFRNKNNSGRYRFHLPGLLWGRFANRIAENRFRSETWKKLSYWLMQSTLPDARYWITQESMSTSYIGEIWLVVQMVWNLLTILFLASRGKVDSQLQWSPPDRTFRAVIGQFIIFSVFNQKTAPKTLHFFVRLAPQTVVIDFEGFRFLISPSWLKSYLVGVLTTTIQFFRNHLFRSI